MTSPISTMTSPCPGSVASGRPVVCVRKALSAGQSLAIRSTPEVSRSWVAVWSICMVLCFLLLDGCFHGVILGGFLRGRYRYTRDPYWSHELHSLRLREEWQPGQEVHFESSQFDITLVDDSGKPHKIATLLRDGWTRSILAIDVLLKRLAEDEYRLRRPPVLRMFLPPSVAGIRLLGSFIYPAHPACTFLDRAFCAPSGPEPVAEHHVLFVSEGATPSSKAAAGQDLGS